MIRILTDGLTSDEWISSVSSGAATDGIVVHHFTSSSNATCTGTGIPTLLVATGLVLSTLRAHNTLWPARRRTSYVSRYTRAHSLPINLTALAVLSTWRWIAWLSYHWS